MDLTQYQAPGAMTAIGVFVIGAVLAAFANYCVDRLGWIKRYRSPWRRFPKEIKDKGVVPMRVWTDFIPIAGWLFLSRFSSKTTDVKPERSERKKSKNAGGNGSGNTYAWIPGLESRTFWIRPLFVELLFAALITWRFFFWFSGYFQPLGLAFQLTGWGVETLLFWICLCASLIDLDDYVIPDSLMIPGVCLGLIAAVSCPLLVMLRASLNWPLDLSGGNSTPCFCLFIANILNVNGVEPNLGNVRFFSGLALALAWTFWAWAVLDRRFYLRLGLRRAVILFFRRLRQSPLTIPVGIVWIIGLIGLFFVTQRCAFVEASAKFAWINALDALAVSFVGLLTGMCLIWAVRLIGGSALGVEAMGFGDVILASMLGVYVGWVGSIVLFFIAPFFGLVFGLIRRGFNSERQIPYGPFLCLGALVFTLKREMFMQALQPYLDDPLFVLAIGGVGFFLLGVMLLILRAFKRMRRD